jgi:hypothetical protein
MNRRRDKCARGSSIAQLDDLFKAGDSPANEDVDRGMNGPDLRDQALGPRPSASPYPREVEQEDLAHASLDRFEGQLKDIVGFPGGLCAFPRPSFVQVKTENCPL